MNGRTRVSALLLLGLATASARAEPRTAEAGQPSARKAQASFALDQTLYSTSQLKRMSVRCRSADDTTKAADATLQCTLFTVSLARMAPETLATFENYTEILREWRTQCRSATTRTEQARKACVACAGKLTDECLYVEAMKQLKRDCATPVRASSHVNPAVRALEQGQIEQAKDPASITARFCTACLEDPSAQCFSRFWHSVPTPSRCTLGTSTLELSLIRQKQTMTFTGTLGDACNTQVVLSYDDPHRSWTFRQLALTPEKCAGTDREGAGSGSAPVVYSSAPSYAFPDLALMCERMIITP